jgi:uncharacterized protein
LISGGCGDKQYGFWYVAGFRSTGFVTYPEVDSRAFHRGLELFNRAHFYDAHEVWEDVWRAAPVDEKKFLQGLVQLAVAFHHHSTGNLAGACSLLRRGSRNLAGYPSEHSGIRVRRLLEEVSHWLDALERGLPLPPHPRVYENSEP